MKKVCSVSEKMKDPEGFQRLQVFDSELAYSESDKILLDKKIQKWDPNTEIIYKRPGIPEPYLFGTFTWVVNDKFIEVLEEKIGEEKLYEEVEFMPIKIVPKDGEGKVYNNYYLVHIIKRIELGDNTKNILKDSDMAFFSYPKSYGVTFSHNVKEIIEKFDIKIIDKFVEEYIIE